MTVSTLARPTRMLATVEVITQLEPIPNADSILRARIRGWDIVVRVGEFALGDSCVYFEVDSLLEVADDRFAFLAPRGVRTDGEGATGHVLKTARFRGQYSQGLALPLSAFPELAGFLPGDDVTDLVPVIKWDPPIPPELVGVIRGFLPDWIPSTDVDRIQNIASILEVGDDTWVPTEKLDGRSTTYYVDPFAEPDAVIGVCTRNLDLLPATNSLWTDAEALGVHDQMAAAFPGERVTLQGETFGEGIQGNPLGLRGHHFAAFNLRVAGQEVPRSEWPAWLLEISVPIRTDVSFPTTVDQALADVDRLKSTLAPQRAAEGIVWRSTTLELVELPNGRLTHASFKVVSNHYLTKHDL